MIAWMSAFISGLRCAGLPRRRYRALLALITVVGTRSLIEPLAVRRPPLITLLLCWTVISYPRNFAAPVQAWVISVCVRQFQFEVIMQERREALFDLFGFGP